MYDDLNLLPPQRTRMLRARARIRAWMLVCVGYTLALGCVWLWMHASAPSPVSGAERIAEVESSLAALERDLRDMQRSSTDASERLATASAVEGHPDWSLLLDLLAHARRDEIAIERVTLASRGGSVSRPGERGILRRGPWSLTLAGLGASQRAVSDFAMRLEASEIFSSVAIVEIRARGSAGADRPTLVEFSLTCTLSDGASTEGRR